MPETLVEAAPSAAPVMEVERGPLVTLTSDQRTEFRRTGNLPEPAKQDPPNNEESAPSDPPKEVKSEAEEAKTAGDPEPPKNKQESRRKPDAEHRIGELTAETKRLKAELEALKSKPSAEPTPKPPIQQQPQFTRPKPTADDKNEDGTLKFATYEDFVEDLADWKGEQRDAKNQREQREREASSAFEAAMQQARDRYENFDEVVGPTATAIHEGVLPVVRQLLLESEVLPDLIFTIGSGEGELAKFLKMPPGKQARYIALTESLINEELQSAKGPKAGEEPPAKPQTKAPKPPSEAGGRAATPPDALEAAVRSGDYRAASAEFKRQALLKLKT